MAGEKIQEANGEPWYKCQACGWYLLSEEIHDHSNEHISEVLLQKMITDKTMKYGKARAEE